MGIIDSIKDKMNKTKPLDVLYKKGKITFEEAVDNIAVDFASSAFYFYDATMQVKRDVARYNENEELLRSTIEDLVSGDKGAEGTGKLFLSTVGKLPKEIKEFIDARNSLNLQGGILSYINYNGMCELAGKESDPDYLFERCFREDIIRKVNEQIPVKLAPDEYDYPDMGQIRHFWRIVCRCHKAMYVDHVECLNENGFVTSENGGLLEIDHVKKLINIDYKGLL